MQLRGIEDLQQFDESFLDRKSRARIEEELRCGSSVWIFRSREEIDNDLDLSPDEKMRCRTSLRGAMGCYRVCTTDGGGFNNELPNPAVNAKDWIE